MARAHPNAVTFREEPACRAVAERDSPFGLHDQDGRRYSIQRVVRRPARVPARSVISF
jgi:hypothetical protein